MTDRSFSHPCPRPSTAADLPTEFEGTWITPRNTRWIFHAEGFVEDHFLPNEYLAQLDANDKLHLFFDGEEDVFDRTEGKPGQVVGKWNSRGGEHDFRSDGSYFSRAASYTQFLSGVYFASTPAANGKFDLETRSVIQTAWIENGKLHTKELLTDDECKETEYEYSFDPTGNVLTLGLNGQNFDFTKSST